MMVGHRGEMPNAGDYLEWEDIEESIVIARLADGSVNALYNVCQHGGTWITPESGH